MLLNFETKENKNLTKWCELSYLIIITIISIRMHVYVAGKN